MDFQRIQIDGFGTLSDLVIDDLTSGLNVYYGVNGSGKTTVLHFLRGLFCGFEEARRLELLPPIRGGVPGGSITLAADRSRFTIVRHGRPGETEALAIQVRQGTAEEAQTLRHQIEHLDRDLVHLLYFVGSYEAHSLSGLIHLALRDGIDLTTIRSDAAWIDPLTASVDADRRQLWEGPENPRLLGELEASADEKTRTFSNAEALQRTRQESVVEELRRTRMHLQRLEGEYAWLLSEIQPVETDLTECQDRLWSRRVRTVRDVQQVVMHSEPVEVSWVREIQELDRQIEHAKQVLRDLAATRLRLTLEASSLACTAIPDEAATLHSQRSLLARLEQQALQLERECAGYSQSHQLGVCSCEGLLNRFSQNLTELRQTIYVLCQQLGRQQSALDRQRLQIEQTRIDQCESEVLERIRRLRLRREDLLAGSQSPVQSRLKHAVAHEVQYCRCDEHANLSAKLPAEFEPATPVVQQVVNERTIEETNARSGDSDLEKKLLTRHRELRQRLFDLQPRIRDARMRLQQLQADQQQFAEDHSVADLAFAAQRAREQLTGAREQWASLLLQRQLLSEARKMIDHEEPSRVIADASAFLNRLTQGRYSTFVYEPATRELFVRSADGRQLPPAALSRGTLDQAALSLRLALVAEYARRGIRLPLVLDDVLVDSDETRLTSAVDLLKEVAAGGQQVIFLTCQEHLSDLFDGHGYSVRTIGGGARRASRLSQIPKASTKVLPDVVARISQADVAPAAPLEVPRVADSLSPLQPPVSPVPHVAENTISGDQAPRMRLQPEGPYWLRVDSPIHLLPSLSTQMASRLAGLGIGNLGELIVLDLESMSGDLYESQISPVQLRVWQAEARLLCCVPDLTGPEAQLLAAIGIQNPVELGAEDGELLAQRIERAGVSGSESWQPWMTDHADWPDRERLRNWIRNGRRAMTLKAACQWAGWRPKRLHDLEAGDWDTWSGDRQRTFRDSGRDREDSSARRRPHGEPSERLGVISQAGDADRSDSGSVRFYLNPDDPVVDAPSIGPKMAERMAAVGILTVQDFLQRSPAVIEERLGDPKVSAETLRTWQAQSSLMCQTPGLRGHDAMLLVACDVLTPGQIAGYSPERLLALVGPFADSREGQRLLRSANPPDLEEVTDWIQWSRQARQLRAA